MEVNGIIYLGEHKFGLLKAIMHWCKVFKLEYNFVDLASYSIKELRRQKYLVRHGENLIVF